MSNAIPDASEIAKAADLDILNAKGDEVKFGSIFQEKKVIVVFIRHFFCGTCQQYVKQLALVSKESLEAANTEIVIVGCGDYQPISEYAEITGFTGQIYANPTRKLYHALGMNIENLETTPAGQQKRSYVTMGYLSNALQSIWKGPLKNPSLIGKQGKISQLGGDFILGPGNQCLFASRMQHTEDHVEVVELMKSAGVSYPST